MQATDRVMRRVTRPRHRWAVAALATALALPLLGLLPAPTAPAHAGTSAAPGAASASRPHSRRPPDPPKPNGAKKQKKSKKVVAPMRLTVAIRAGWAGLPTVVVRGPRGYSRTISASAVITVRRPGNYRVIAPPVSKDGLTAWASVWPSRVRLKRGASATMTVRYPPLDPPAPATAPVPQAPAPAQFFGLPDYRPWNHTFPAMQTTGVAVYDPETGAASLHQGLVWDMRDESQPRTVAAPTVVGKAGVPPGIYDTRWNRDGVDQTAVTVVSTPPRAPASRIAVIVPDYTWQAYNAVGGANLYTTAARAVGVAMQRPISVQSDSVHHPAANPLTFLTARFGPVDVIAQSALEEHAADYDLSAYRVLVIYGHDEYWTKQIRAEIETAVRSGTNLLNLSGNTCWWVARDTGGLLTRDGLWSAAGGDDETRLLGGSFRYAGYSLDKAVADGLLIDTSDAPQRLAEQGMPLGATTEETLARTGGLRVLDATDPLFAGTGLVTGDWIGVNSRVNRVETDGFPLTPLGQPDIAASAGYVPEGFQALADGWNYRAGYRHSAVIRRNRLGAGSVISMSSIGWVYGLLDADPVILRITGNAVESLLAPR